MSDLISPEDKARVRAAVGGLIEHFDSVRIFVTKHDGSNDLSGGFDHGAGNFFTQFGQVCEALDRMREQARIEVRKSADNDE